MKKRSLILSVLMLIVFSASINTSATVNTKVIRGVIENVSTEPTTAYNGIDYVKLEGKIVNTTKYAVTVNKVTTKLVVRGVDCGTYEYSKSSSSKAQYIKAPLLSLNAKGSSAFKIKTKDIFPVSGVNFTESEYKGTTIAVDFTMKAKVIKKTSLQKSTSSNKKYTIKKLSKNAKVEVLNAVAKKGYVQAKVAGKKGYILQKYLK